MNPQTPLTPGQAPEGIAPRTPSETIDSGVPNLSSTVEAPAPLPAEVVAPEAVGPEGKATDVHAPMSETPAPAVPVEVPTPTVTPDAPAEVLVAAEQKVEGVLESHKRMVNDPNMDPAQMVSEQSAMNEASIKNMGITLEDID